MRLRALLPLALAISCSGPSSDRPGAAPPPRPPPAAATSLSPPPAAPRAPIDLAALKDDEACALPAAGDPTLIAAGPFDAPEPRCKVGKELECDSVDDPPPGADACFIANASIQRAEKKARAGRPGAAPAADPWDGARRPRYLDRIDAHFHLTPDEHALLRRNGFIVLDRLAYTDHASAFHDIFQEQLPLYVGIDPILHAVFRGTETVLQRVEQTRLDPALKRLLRKLRGSLARSRGVYDDTTLADLDVYLGVAAELSGERAGAERPLSLFGHDDAVRAVLDQVAGKGLVPVELFGRPRMIDFSQLEPRGHYAAPFVPDASWSPSSYFQAVMWLSRLEWNLVSRSSRSSHPDAAPDPRETPREARDALALADLVERAGVLPELAAFEQVYQAFAGRREDVSVPDLLRLMKASAIRPSDPAAPEKLKAAIGKGFRRAARTHFMPQNAPDLPVIATLLGPRVVPDIAPLTRLVHDRVPGRTQLGAADVGYLLGHDRARSLLDPDLRRFPELGAALAAAREELAASAALGSDLQASWLRALLAASRDPDGVKPSFMGREAHADLRMNSALVGFAQLRHTFVLVAGQGYDAYGCEIPDAYVEPLLPVYDALLAHVEGLRKAAGGGFAGLGRVLETLRAIVKTELAAGAPSEAQRTWLAMVAEHLPLGGYGGDSGEPPKWTGWYFDMFEDREIGATRAAALVADYMTLTNRNEVAYLGADGPRLGVFVVDAGGEPRAMVGPVAKGYEVHAPVDGRLDDAAARTSPDRKAPWRDSFAAPARLEPALGLSGRFYACRRRGMVGGGAVEARVVLASERELGAVSVTLLDHHGDPLHAPVTREVDEGLTVLAFRLPNAVTWESPVFGGSGVRTPVEALHVRVEDLGRSGAGKGRYDYATSPSVFVGKDFEVEGLAVRPRGVGAFTIGEGGGR